MIDEAKSEKIAKLNDLLRTTGIEGKTVLSHAMAETPATTRNSVISAIRSFDSFDDPQDEESDNPYGERDFGAVTVEQEKYFWKIDYHDPQTMFHSDDPSDPKVTLRVLTIMHCSEY